MSVKKWASYVDEDGKQCVVNIDWLDEKTRGRVYTCVSCGKRLYPHMGENVKWYFSHSRNDEGCTGGSSESVLKELFKRVIDEAHCFTVPSGSLEVHTGVVTRVNKGFKLYYASVNRFFDFEVKDRKVDVAFLHEDTYYLVDLVTSEPQVGKVSQLFDKPYVYIQIDVQNFIQDIENLVYADFLSTVTIGTTCKTVVASSVGDEYLEMDRKCRVKLDGEFIICHADETHKRVVSIRQCKACPYYVQGMYCYGKDALCKPSDYTRRISRQSRLEDTPDGIGVVTFADRPGRFGTCKCGGDYTLVLGKNAPHKIKGLKTCKEDDCYVYLKCKKCKKVKNLYCPVCKKMHMFMYRNDRSGRVFLMCDNYDECGVSLTIWENEPVSTDNYADEMKAMETLDKFLSLNKAAQKRLKKVKYGESS